MEQNPETIERPTRIAFDPQGIIRLAHETLREPVAIHRHPKLTTYGLARLEPLEGQAPARQAIAELPPLYPEWLGDRSFNETHHTRFAYVGGAMARGISSVELVTALAHAGAIGFFGAAGTALNELESSLKRLSAELDPRGLSWGSNLIHTPHSPELEEQVVDLYLKLGVKRVSASAFMDLSPSIVRYACRGLNRDANGRAIRSNFVFAKISRPEVAKRFLSPPPDALLEKLVVERKIARDEADIAATLPLSEDVTVESDSGGHTDNRPLGSLFPVIQELAVDLSEKFGYDRPIRIGAAGGLGSPQGLAAAYALGAAYVLLGSVHQASVESGLAEGGKRMLAQANVSDVAMTASADMFEAGVKVQVLKRGTLMANRGNTLYRIYKEYPSIEDIPVKTRLELERSIFQAPLDTIWKETKSYFAQKDPQQIVKAEADPKRQMALVFRWYLGNSSHWPIAGEEGRQADYQIWCGPAMGAFNNWVRGSFLEAPENRRISQIALNLMEGAARLTRLQQLRAAGLPIPGSAFRFSPRPLAI